MKINPDDPWYPTPYKFGEMCPHNVMGGCPVCLGVTTRLKLAADAMQSLININQSYGSNAEPPGRDDIVVEAFRYADSAIECDGIQIEQANREEGKQPD